MSKIPTLAKMDPKKTIFSSTRSTSRLTSARSHVCPRTSELTALKNRIVCLEKIIAELHSRDDTRDIEKLLQKNTIDHQLRLLEIIDRNITTNGQMVNKAEQNEQLKSQSLLLEIRAKYIVELLQNEDVIKNLLEEKQSNEKLMHQTEKLLLDKEKMIDILCAVIQEKDNRLSELDRMKSVCESKSKALDQNRVNMQERIVNLVTENLRYRTLRSLTQN